MRAHPTYQFKMPSRDHAVALSHCQRFHPRRAPASPAGRKTALLAQRGTLFVRRQRHAAKLKQGRALVSEIGLQNVSEPRR